MTETTTPPAPSVRTYDPMGMLRSFGELFQTKRFIEQDAFGRKEVALLRLRLISEEYHEVSDELLDLANGHGDRSKLARELADLLYTVYGAAYDFEIPLPGVFKVVHESNMAKVDAEGNPILDKHGKILKPIGWKAPDVDSVLFDGASD